ncbi:MAG: DUF389 domain-containing protein [Pseudomonadota bacterium]
MTVKDLTTTKNILRFEGHSRRAYWRRFSMLLGLSVVIATMGLVRNSGAVVIAAMLIAPLMTPILGVAAAMVTGRIVRALRLLAIVLLAASFCILLAWVMVYLAGVPRGITIPDQVVSRTDPGIEDLIIALAAGVAGAYVQIQRSEIALLPGAAIGVSLVPPLAAAGILLYFRELEDAYEAGLLFATNLCAIVMAASIVYLTTAGMSGILKHRRRRASFGVGLAVTLALLGFVAVQLTVATVHRFEGTRLEGELAVRIAEWADPTSVEVIRLDVRPRRRTADLWLIVDLPFDASQEVESIAESLPDKIRMNPVREVIADVLGEGYIVAIRFQTRIAGLTSTASDFIIDAPAVEDLTD